MSRRPGISGHDADNDPRQGPEAEAAVVTSAIAGLRRRLRGHAVIDHPAVRRELRKLAELLAAFEQAGHRPGRHRAQPGMSPRNGRSRTRLLLAPQLSSSRSSASTSHGPA